MTSRFFSFSFSFSLSLNLPRKLVDFFSILLKAGPQALTIVFRNAFDPSR